jgi:serine/threonine-protein kinase
MSQDKWQRFKTGQAMQGRLLQDLVAHAGAGAVLPAGALLGPWRVVELLGSGGMAHVYLAERADGQFEQQVALKVVRRNAHLIDRLRHERQIVATLRHPHIVSLVDGGETTDGDLWFAMAVVDGLAIDKYAIGQGLDWQARLRLFDAVCAAVEYAHGRALIHRDIKPANILVDSNGHPRLLDFGIALAGDGDGSDDHALTPGFASPEQLAGQAISITSDIFQLGLVLRTLLIAGNPPAPSFPTTTVRIRPQNSTVVIDPDEPRRAETGEPDARRTAVTADNWVAMPGPARQDLARLIARATAADPQARYATTAALREDLASVLARRPLAQDRGSTRLRLARFVERHRVPAVVVVLATLILVTSLTAAALRLRDERNLAIANAQRATAVSEFLVNTLTQANPYAAQKGAISVLDAMDHAATTLDQNLDNSPDLRRELRATIGSVYLNLDEANRCLDLLGAAQAEQDLSGAAPTDQARSLILRSECHLALDQREAAWRWLDSAQAALEGVRGTSADQLRAFILVDRGQLLSLDGKLIEANPILEQALALALQSGDSEQAYRANRFLGYNLQNAGENERAVSAFTRALELATQTLGPSHRNTLTTAGNLAVSLGRLQRWDEADATIKTALVAAESIRHRGATADIVIAQLRDSYANLLWQQDRLDECIVQARLSLEIYQRMAAQGSTQGFNPSWRVATCAYQGGQLDLAFDYATQALGYAENGAPMGVINALRMLAAVAARRDELALAADYLARADAALAKTEVANPNVLAALHLTRALLAVRSGDVAAARAHLAQADDSVKPPGQYAGWLLQEHADVMAMIGAMD